MCSCHEIVILHHKSPDASPGDCGFRRHPHFGKAQHSNFKRPFRFARQATSQASFDIPS